MLEERVAGAEQLTHVAREHERVDHAAEPSEGGVEVEAIAHDGAATRIEVKPMIVIEAAKGAIDHRVTEVDWALKRGDATRQSLPHAEMCRFPSDGFAEADQPARDARYGALLGGVQGALMKVDAAGEVEAALRRGVDECGQLNARHEVKTTVAG